MGRPPTRPKRLKDGFYIEVRSKGTNSGMKIRSDSKDEMQKAADFYSRNKEVIILGEHKDDVWMNEKAVADKLKQDKKAQKAKEKEKVKSEKAATKPKKEEKPKKEVKPKKAAKSAKKKK